MFFGDLEPIIKIRKLPTCFRIWILASKMYVFWYFTAYNRNTETADIVGSFRIWILAN